jgi:calcineurin-like phosphoesterase family protein
MEISIINLYNSVVLPKDTVYFLGDFAFANKWHEIKRILDKMHGKKILIRGNHDKLTTNGYRKAGFDKVYNSLWVRGFYLVHNSEDNCFDSPCICGHIHTYWLRKGKNYNVSVDLHNYLPVSEGKILKELKWGR